MSSGGLTGGAGGSIAGTSPLPSSWRKQPDGADLLMYMRSGPPKSDSGKKDQPKADIPTSNDAGVDVPTDEQSQKLQDFDAMQGRGPLVPLGDKDPNKPPLQPAPEPTCEKGSAADVALRGAGGFVEGAYSVVREPVLAVHDAAGAVLHHTGDRVAGTDHFKGHADRTQARIEAITDPVGTVKATAETVGGAIEDAGDGCYGPAAELGGQVAGSTIVPGGALSRILRVGDDRWVGADAPSGKPDAQVDTEAKTHTASSRPHISEERAEHILYGDATGGGHLHPGGPGKSSFPMDWSADKVLDAIESIAADNSIPGRTQPNGRILKDATIDGVDVKVVIEPESRGSGVVTGFPTNLARNAR